jgi:hypothetical protein
MGEKLTMSLGEAGKIKFIQIPHDILLEAAGLNDIGENDALRLISHAQIYEVNDELVEWHTAGFIDAPQLPDSHFDTLKQLVETSYAILKYRQAQGDYTYRAFYGSDVEEHLASPRIIPPPQLGERILLLILTKEERVNIPGDLEEEYRGIAAKHGARYARLWYYKQVVASAWPMMRKAVRLGLLAWIEEFIRRRV